MPESVYLNKTAITVKTMALCFKKLRDLDQNLFIGSKMTGGYSIKNGLIERLKMNYNRLRDHIRKIKYCD